jgi:hypothetical protein
MESLIRYDNKYKQEMLQISSILCYLLSLEMLQDASGMMSRNHMGQKYGLVLNPYVQ